MLGTAARMILSQKVLSDWVMVSRPASYEYDQDMFEWRFTKMSTLRQVSTCQTMVLVALALLTARGGAAQAPVFTTLYKI